MKVVVLRRAWIAGLIAGYALSAFLRAQPTLEFTRTSVQGQSIRLAWSDVGANRAYTVQARDAVAAGPWFAPRVGAPWPLAGREWSDPVVGEARFYRVLAVETAQRGKLLRSELVQSMSASQINLVLLFMGVPLTANYGVQVHKLVYETIDPFGGRTEASGAAVLPDNPGKALPLCSYQHGTIARRSEAPSRSGSTEQMLGVILAATGYATVLPDYLGMGDSNLVHPYHHAGSEATAGVDMLRAMRGFCQQHGVALNDQLFLVGYSQGGHATMALHRELEEYHTDEFTITASAPMAGAYDLSGVTTDDFLSGRPVPNPYYFALLLASYQSVYHLADSLADLLKPPYDTQVPPLLDGNHTGSEINAVLPADVSLALNPAVLARLRNDPRSPLRVALRENDLYRWTPVAPLRLYHCRGDGDVTFLNSQVAVESFHQRGASQVELIDPAPAADHGDCVQPSLLSAKAWFDQLRK